MFQDLKMFLTEHNHPQLDGLHAALLRVFDHRQQQAPLQTNRVSPFEALALASAGGVLALTEQAYIMLTVGSVIGAKLVIDAVSDRWQQRKFSANEDQIDHLNCQTELFCHQHPQYAHVGHAVRFMVCMGLSQEDVAQLTQALQQFNPEQVAVEVLDVQQEQRSHARQLRL